MFSGSDSINRPATSNVVHRTLNAHRDCAPLPQTLDAPQAIDRRPQTTWTSDSDRIDRPFILLPDC